jgi:tryptophan synthase alpha chain
MNRITQRLNDAKQQGRKALVTYIVSGDPEPDATLPAMHQLVASGADIIELGVPFSDPMAEGPSIQRAHERALANGTSLRRTLDVVRAFRETNTETPIVLMGYANPIERMGYQAFAKAAAEVGVDGLLTVDFPPEEAEPLNVELKDVGIENIFLIAPTTTTQRIQHVASLAGGFLYYVSLKGVTGAAHIDAASVQQKLTEIRAHSELPVLVGFGIKDAASAKAIGKLADGVVIGSVLVDAMGQYAGQSGTESQICTTLDEILKPIRSGLDATTE